MMNNENSTSKNIRGIIFDYGGTIDTDAVHWAEVIWRAYKECGVGVSEQNFRMAYVHGERSLAKFPLIKPDDNFLQLLRIKINIQTSFLVDAHLWDNMEKNENKRRNVTEDIAVWCYNFVLKNLEISRPVLKDLATYYPLVLVSNFYGNINAILKDFKLDFFKDVIESSVVGVRKPDPQIFRLGVEALGMTPQETVVIGDSFDKDIIPANAIGCNTVWIKGIQWDKNAIYDENLPNQIITSIKDLKQAINIINSQFPIPNSQFLIPNS